MWFKYVIDGWWNSYVKFAAVVNVVNAIVATPELFTVCKSQRHGREEDTIKCCNEPTLPLVTRPEEIAVIYQDYNGVWREATYSGISARCFQHELDHLNGIVYTSKCKPLALEQGEKKRNKLMKKIGLK